MEVEAAIEEVKQEIVSACDRLAAWFIRFSGECEENFLSGVPDFPLAPEWEYFPAAVSDTAELRFRVFGTDDREQCAKRMLYWCCLAAFRDEFGISDAEAGLIREWQMSLVAVNRKGCFAWREPMDWITDLCDRSGTS